MCDLMVNQSEFSLGKHSIGVGDRFGYQGVAQLAAVQKAVDLGLHVTPVWNKSFREHQIIGTTPQDQRQAAIFRHTPMGRFGESSELIGTLLWLAADKASSFVTGALIQVDGGFSAMSI